MMKPTCQDFLPLLLLLCLCRSVSSFEPYESPLSSDCNPVSKPIKNPQLKHSIDRLVAQLVSNVVPTRFTTGSYGDKKTAVNGLLQCRGDVSEKQCAACAREAWTKLNSTCAKDGQARLWFERCFLRYSTKKFFGKLDRMNYWVLWNNAPEVANKADFVEKVGKLMRNLSAVAAVPGRRALGTGETKINATLTIYGMAQCTRDLAPALCTRCLNKTVTDFLDCCTYNERGMALLGSCQIRFESYPFIDPKT